MIPPSCQKQIRAVDWPRRDDRQRDDRGRMMQLRAHPAAGLARHDRDSGRQIGVPSRLAARRHRRRRQSDHGLLEGADVLATAAALRALGVDLERRGDGVWEVDGVGVGGLAEADRVARPRQCRHRRPAAPGPARRPSVHDLSHRRRFAARAADGAGSSRRSSDGRALSRAQRRAGFLSRSRHHRALPIHYRPPVASAQVKSAILLAGCMRPGAPR